MMKKIKIPKNEPNVWTFIPPKVLMGELENPFNELKTLISKLSLTDVVFYCSRLNTTLSDPRLSLKEIQDKVAGFVTTDEDLKKINKYICARKSDKPVSLFFRGQQLELIRWALAYGSDKTNDGSTFEDPEIRQCFLRAALICGKIWARRLYGKRFEQDDDLNDQRKKMMGPFRQAVADTVKAPEFYITIARSLHFFKDYFPTHWPSFDDDFRSASGLTFEEYIDCSLTVLTHQFFNEDENGRYSIFSYVNLDNLSHNSEIFEKYIDLVGADCEMLTEKLWSSIPETESLSLDSIPPFSHRFFREKPLFKSADGRAIIIDPVIFCTHLMQGPLFAILGMGKSANEIFGAFGYAFEDYCKDSLQNRYGSSNIIDCRFASNYSDEISKNEHIEIDGLVNDISDLIIFESKAVWVKDELLLDDSYEKYLDYLKQKYATTKDGREVGIKQLSKVVNLVTSKKWLGKESEFSKVKLIYPVLLVHDSLLSMPLYGEFLADEFKNSLQNYETLESGLYLSGGVRIMPLVVMTLDDLENLKNSTEFTLKQLFDDYHKYAPDRRTSLKDFVVNSDYCKYIKRDPKDIDIALKAIRETKQRMFKDNGGA